MAIHDCALSSIDGALDEWIPKLLQALKTNGFCTSTPVETEAPLPLPRITISTPESSSSRGTALDDFIPSAGFFAGTIRCNKRITASDWYQDVRHIEFEFEDDIQ